MRYYGSCRSGAEVKVVYIQAMRRYFFNLYDDVGAVDEEGVWLSDVETALAHAFKEVRSLAASSVLDGYLTCHHRIEIVDEHQNLIDTVRFDDAVEIRP